MRSLLFPDLADERCTAFAIRKPEHKVLFPGVEELTKGTYQPVEGGDKFAGALRRYGCAKLCMVLFMCALSPPRSFCSHICRYAFQNRLDSSTLKKISIIAHDPAAVGGTNHYETQTFPIHMYIILKYLMVPVQAVSTFFFPNGPMRTTVQVGKDLCFACFDEVVLGKNPKALYVDGVRIADSSPESHDVEKQERLWRETVELAGLKREDVGVEGII